MTSSNTKLNILLNNTNKALVQVLLDATKDDLKAITKDTKDLRSIMDKVLKQTKQGDSSSNKAMLELVKNNPTLKSLGNPSSTIKELINTIKSDKNPLPIEKVLKNILVDIKDIKTTDIKPKLDNSGVFLESKIKHIKNPQVELKNNLNDLKELVKQSPLPEAKDILKKIEVLLKDNIVKTATNNDLSKDIKQNPKQLETLTKQVRDLVDKIDKIIQKADIIYAPKTKEILSKLEFATKPTQAKIPVDKPISNEIQIKQEIKDVPNKVVLQNTNEVKLKIPIPTPASPLNAQNLQIMKIGSNILSSIKEPLPQTNIEQVKLEPVKTTVKTIIKIDANVSTNATKLVDDAPIKLPIIKEALQALQTVLDKSLTLESKTVLKSINTILASLNSNKEMPKELKQDISKLIQDTKQIVQKTDVIYSKDLLTVFSKLKNLSTQNSLNTQANTKEMLSNDLKATLLQTTSELQNSSHPNKNDLIKQMDKVLLQIDHYQLVSHLSNATSVYLPITWDQLEGGELDIRRDNDRFYCDIDLNLKDYGDLSLKLTLFEKNQINIHLYSPNQELKKLFQESLTILRTSMISAQIVPREIRFHDGLEKESSTSSPYQGESDDFNIGFEVKG